MSDAGSDDDEEIVLANKSDKLVHFGGIDFTKDAETANNVSTSDGKVYRAAYSIPGTYESVSRSFKVVCGIFTPERNALSLR